MDCLPWLYKLYPARAARQAQAQAQAQAQSTLEARIADEMKAQLEEIRAEPIFCCQPSMSEVSSNASDASDASDASCKSGYLYWEQLSETVI